jgi:hypothetical protein
MTSTQALRCRKAAGLMSRRLDERLRLSERLGLGAHLLLCKGCRSYDEQLQLLRSATRNWQAYQDEGTRDP